MGFIPVFLAIFGFVFLFLGVVYHSLKRALGRVRVLEAAQGRFATANDEATLARNIAVARNRYNKLRKDTPYKFVAAVFGFRGV